MTGPTAMLVGRKEKVLIVEWRADWWIRKAILVERMVLSGGWWNCKVWRSTITCHWWDTFENISDILDRSELSETHFLELIFCILFPVLSLFFFGERSKRRWEGLTHYSGCNLRNEVEWWRCSWSRARSGTTELFLSRTPFRIPLSSSQRSLRISYPLLPHHS